MKSCFNFFIFLSELKCTLILDCRLASFSSKKITSFGKFGRHLSELGMVCGICRAVLPKLSINRDASELVADNKECSDPLRNMQQ